MSRSMRAYIFIFFILSTVAHICHAIEKKALLARLGPIEFQRLRIAAEASISSERNKEVPIHVDENQSFHLTLDEKINLNLIPVVFNSLRANNDVCVLTVFSKTNQLIETIPLLYVRGDADEVVESCVGVQAVTTYYRDRQQLLIYLLRYRAGNQYGDRVVVSAVEPDKVRPLPHLTACVSQKTRLDSMARVRGAINKCRPGREKSR